MTEYAMKSNAENYSSEWITFIENITGKLRASLESSPQCFKVELKRVAKFLFSCHIIGG